MPRREFGGIHVENPTARAIARVTREVASHVHVGNFEMQERQEAALNILTTVGARREVPAGAIAEGQVKPASSDDYEIVRGEVVGLRGKHSVSPESVITRPLAAGRRYLEQQHRASLQRERDAIETDRKIPAPGGMTVATGIATGLNTGWLMGQVVSDHPTVLLPLTALTTVVGSAGIIRHQRNYARRWREETNTMIEAKQQQIDQLKRW